MTIGQGSDTSHKKLNENLVLLRGDDWSVREQGRLLSLFGMAVKLLNMWALFSGFAFAAITMILFQYPDLSQISAQVTLFVLTVMLDQFLLQLYSRDFNLRNCVKVAPKLPDFPTYTGMLLTFIFTGLSWILLSGSVVLIFFIWNLVYLALASTIVGVFYIVAAYYLYVKAWRQFLSEIRKV